MLAAFNIVLPSMSRDGTFVFIEKWSSEEVMNKLRCSALFHEAMSRMSDCCDRPLEIEHLDTVEDFDLSSLVPMKAENYPSGKANLDYYPDLGDMTPVYK